MRKPPEAERGSDTTSTLRAAPVTVLRSASDTRDSCGREPDGPVFLARGLGMAASTVGRILRRRRVIPLRALDPITGGPVRRQQSARRYEHPRPGDLVHIDVKKLGRVPDGGGWRLHSRSEEVRGRKVHGQALGYDFLHVAVDDHSRLAYVEALPDERDPTSAGFLRRATAWFADHGVPRARGPDQQRPCLPGRPRLDPGLRRARDQPPVHPPALPLDERESRAVQPDPAR